MTSLSEIPKSNISATNNVKSQPTKIKSLATWRDAIKENWQTLKTESENTKLASVYHQLVYIALKPILPSNKSDLKQLINILQKTPYCQALATLIKTIYEHESFSIDVVSAPTRRVLHAVPMVLAPKDGLQQPKDFRIHKYLHQ